MKYKIVYDAYGRLRLRCGNRAFYKECENSIVKILADIKGVLSVSVSAVNGGILVYYDGDVRNEILDTVENIQADSLIKLPLSQAQIIDEKFNRDFINIIRQRLIIKFFVPSFIRLPLTLIKAVPFVKKGIKSLMAGKLNVDVLDAASISAAIASGAVSTASSVMMLLNISALLEGYTRQKAKTALSDSLSLNIDKAWLMENGEEKCVPLSDIKIGDVIKVRQGSMIPVDGAVSKGEAGVNEASMTGESLPVHKKIGMSVYAGTVVSEGDLEITVSKYPDDSRIYNIIELIENSEELKSSAQTKAEGFADKLVPYSLFTSLFVYLFTGNVTKALSVLMVDYSCAIKLSAPICVISAMKEAAGRDIMIKGGRFLENYSFADTILFDKTGTLTVSCPKLSRIVSFNGYDENTILKIAACLEEHFPHSVAKAIVHAASDMGLEHTEEHAEVEYIVAHGISSYLNGEKTLIGSAHFVFDDEGIILTEEQEQARKKLGEKYSMVYLAIGGKLCGILCIEDPIRFEAKDVIKKLKQRGMNNIIMITGDGENTAANVCKELGIEKFYARVLPEDKLNVINALKAEKHTAVMVGDGINDSPALAAADVSVAMKDASDIARETADITLLSSNLEKLVTLRDLSEAMFKRIHKNYRFISAFNSGLILLGIGGAISPVTSALLHNVSTLAICANSMKPFLKDE